jgi:hypothetical protein
VVSKLNARLKKLFILTGLLAAADMVQGTVMYAFGKSDGTILGKNGLIKTLRLPQGNELKNLVIMSLTTSVIVGTLSDRVEKRLGLEDANINDLDDAILATVKELGE